MSKITFTSALELFLESRETYCSNVTVENYKNTLNYFQGFITVLLDSPADDLDVSQITIRDLNKYSIYLKSKIKNDNNPFTPSGSGLISSRTRKDYLKDVMTFYNFLEDNEYIENNPTKKLKLPKVLPQPLEPLTSDEVKRIDECYNPDTKLGARNLAIIHCLLDEGMRSGEVQRLLRKDVNFCENYIVIRNSKGGKGRIIPLAAIPRKYLINYFDKLPEMPQDNDYVFYVHKGDSLTEDSIKCFFQRLKIKSGIPRIYPHLLRHTFATSFILGGGSLELLRIYMGHSSIETTQKYLHVANNMRFMKNIYPLDKCFLQKFY